MKVKVEWIDDPGGKVDGQWKVTSSFWGPIYPTEEELADLIQAATEAKNSRERRERS